MSELEQAASGAISSSSGEGQKEGVESTGGDSSQSANYQKLLKEKQNHAKAHSELKEKYEAIQVREKERVEKELIAKDEHLKLIHMLKEEKGQLTSKIQNLQSTITEGQTNALLLQELKKLGFNDTSDNKEAALKLIDKSMVSFDNESGVVLGADVCAKSFHEKFHGLGLFGKRPTGTSNQAPQMLVNPDKSINEMSQTEKWELFSKVNK